MATYTRGYESVAELVEKATASRRRGAYNRFTGRGDWVGRAFRSWEEVVAAANGLWESGVRDIESMLADLASVELPQPACRRRRGVWADDGDEFDHDRFRAGRECWRTLRRQHVTGPQHITLVAQVGGMFGVPPEEFFWRGAVAVCLADLLEKAGYRVTMYAASKTSNSYTNGCGSFRFVQVKGGGDPVNLASLVNAFSPWLYRTVFFQEHYTQAEAKPRNPGYGRTADLTDPDLEEIEPGAILIQGVSDRRRAVAKVREVIEALSQ